MEKKKQVELLEGPIFKIFIPEADDAFYSGRDCSGIVVCSCAALVCAAEDFVTGGKVMKEIDVKELQKNPFSMIGDEWMLITAEKEGKINTMTASWGGVGVLWGKNVVTAYIRPQRYTKEFVDASETFTISVLGEAHRKALSYLGSRSGRDEDKIAAAGLHPVSLEGEPSFEEAELVFVCRKCYHDRIRPENMLNPSDDERWYPEKDYHEIYIGEIVKAYVK